MSSQPTETDASRIERYRRERQFGRRCALQFLYQADVQDDWGNVERNLALLRRQVRELDEAPEGTSFDHAWQFAERLVRGVLTERSGLDERITASATNWTLARMSVVDRNILRLASFELHCCDDVPELTALDEGVELAKAFGHADSSRFVNGVLDRMLRDRRASGALEASPATADSAEGRR
jgi:N utilization substance protein B